MRKFCLIAFCCLAVSLYAEEKRIVCRHGVVTEAVIENVKLEQIRNYQDMVLDFGTDFPATPVFVSVSMDVMRNRTLSIFDYKLVCDGKVYPCIAIANGDIFAYTQDVLRGGRTRKLLFAVNGSEWRTRKLVKLNSSYKPFDKTYSLELTLN